MFKSFNRNQEFLLPPSLQDLIPDGDLVHVVAEATELLDFQPLYYRYSTLGQNAYHPAMLLSLLFYSYARGTFSSRKIARQVKENVSFMYITGMQTPDFRTISDFRKDNIDLLKQYFVQIVQICQAAGMTPLGKIAIDGSKMHAAASGKQTMNRKQLAKQLEMTQQEIDRLLKFAEEADAADEQSMCSDAGEHSPLTMQIKDIKALHCKLKEAQSHLDSNHKQGTINLTDPDCRYQRNVGPGYNSQIAVDCESQIIVAANVVSENNDAHQLLSMINETEDNTKSKGQPKRVFADSGYASAAAYKELEQAHHIDAYVPTQEQVYHSHHPISPFHKSRFELDPDRLTCRCPLGHYMRIIRRGTNKSGEPYVNFIGTECPLCPSKSQCTKSKYRNIIMYIAEDVVQRMKRKMNTYAGHVAMCIRRQTVEPVFGQLKEHIGFRCFHLCGLRKVKGEFALLCGAFNLKKLHKYLHGRALAGALAQIRAIPVQTTVLLHSLCLLSRYQRLNHKIIQSCKAF